jgi:hypothetical protein
MLESNSFLLIPHKQRSNDVYSILDGQTRDPIGIVLQQRRLLEPTLRLLGGWLPPRLSVLEGPDRSLVFTIRKVGLLFQPQFEVLDAMGARIGTLIRGGHAIHDRYASLVATMAGSSAPGEYQFHSPDSAESLACVSRDASREGQLDGTGCLVVMSCKLDEQPFTKMLLLSATVIAEQFGKRKLPAPALNSLR